MAELPEGVEDRLVYAGSHRGKTEPPKKYEGIAERADEMVIAKMPPPNIAEIEKIFPGVGDGTRPIFFCYGRVIYNPSGANLPVQIIAHEAVHSLQQEKLGVERWWDLYLAIKQFRFEQETDAHAVEYEFFKACNNRHFSRQYLNGIAERLAGPLYGNMTTRLKAKRLIAA